MKYNCTSRPTNTTPWPTLQMSLSQYYPSPDNADKLGLQCAIYVQESSSI